MRISAPANYTKPLPKVDSLTAPFWKSTRIGRLTLQKCGKCQRFQFYPRPVCSHCGSSEIIWAEVSGRGTIYSFTIIRQVVANVKAFEHDLPFVVALVELDVGPRIVSNIVDCELEDIKIGMEVEVFFEKVTDEITLPKFKRITQEEIG